MAGLGQRLVLGHRIAGEAFGRAARDGGEAGGVALQQGEVAPMLEGVEQFGEVQYVAGSGEGLLVGGLKGDPVLGQ